ncbi:MAG TPA: FAD-dependent oxidoreductase [Solirubrobacterales bacterium]|nr:FAD-dependent oxidoreductase [Solirubrobacterales bacterium]
MSAAGQDLDFLVLGAGMAGMSAAARAAQSGARVAVVERGPEPGGSAVFAEFIWTAPSVEVMREVNPDGDPELARVAVEEFAPAMDWIRSLGVSVGDPVELLGYGVGHQTDMAALFRAYRAAVEDAGGEVLTEAEPLRLLIDDGAVRGAEVRLAGGETRELRAPATLLATGGYAGDPQLRAERIHPNAAGLPLRANKFSAGAGLRLGEEAGAAFGIEDACFYGHLMARGLAMPDGSEIAINTFFHSEHGVLVNLDGERFCDETIGDQLNAIALVEQPEARGLLITDQRVHDEWMLKPYVKGLEPVDKFQLAYRRGARCATAADLDEFEALPPEWGFPGEKVRDTLVEFNRRCEAGDLSPSRARDAMPLLDPPYYVIEVTTGITFTMGGLRIDVDGHALDPDDEPIPGLFAAGADAGGLYRRAYAGGLAPALVFGLRAAAAAVAANQEV